MYTILMPEKVTFDPKEKKEYSFEPAVNTEPSLSKELIKQGTVGSFFTANVILIIFTIVFFTISFLIIKHYIIDLV